MRLRVWLLLPSLIVAVAFAVLVFFAEGFFRRGTAVASHGGEPAPAKATQSA